MSESVDFNQACILGGVRFRLIRTGARGGKEAVIKVSKAFPNAPASAEQNIPLRDVPTTLRDAVALLQSGAVPVLPHHLSWIKSLTPTDHRSVGANTTTWCFFIFS